MKKQTNYYEHHLISIHKIQIASRWQLIVFYTLNLSTNYQGYRPPKMLKDDW